MLNQFIRLNKDRNTDILFKSLIFSVVTCLLGPVVITMKGEMPITMQSFIVLFVPIAFGWRTGLLTCSIYLFAGIMGLPVFAGYRSGIDSILSANGGFYFGFLIACLVVGMMTEMNAFKKPITSIILWITGHIIILVLGAIWLMKFNPLWKEMMISALPGALIKSAIGALIIQIISRLLQGREKHYS